MYQSYVEESEEFEEEFSQHVTQFRQQNKNQKQKRATYVIEKYLVCRRLNFMLPCMDQDSTAGTALRSHALPQMRVLRRTLELKYKRMVMVYQGKKWISKRIKTFKEQSASGAAEKTPC
ncbi:hypothetical protein Pcinc_003042 [Petrolisthes cinctipes]|uniref:Uncharacterized protein n=1 Tax=Petrolisthes cinctipes TaxID=88211 RepID=A0AAE1GJR3_PETCI|nr:hypothetical protein Pcinc_003042 [Petrolisthes cinctipes]